MTISGLTPFQSGYRLFSGEQMNALASAAASAVPWPGNFIYLDPASGSDQYTGKNNPNAPVQTLSRAYAMAEDGNNDVIVLVGDGTTAATARLSESFTWSKNATHLIGITAPTMIAQRARISTATGATTNLNPLLTVSGNGCIFSNFSFFQGVGQTSTAENLISVSGDRNYFGNVQFGGMGSAAGAAEAGSVIIGLAGGDENLFEGCAIGLETQARSAANASVKLVSASQRNMFKDCLFQMYPTANSPLFVNAALSGGLNGSTMTFENCSFQTLMNATSSTQPAVTCTSHASLNGTIYFNNCRTGAAKWAAASATVKVMSFATAATTGFNAGVYASAADS